MVRTSLEHAFISGTSLWSDARTFKPVKECASDLKRPEMPSKSCRSFLAASEKANLQWTLESQLYKFESQPWPSTQAPFRSPD
jgi:adenosine deaminase